jgi:hypothetical protein
LSPSDIFPLTSSAVRSPKSLPVILSLKNITSVLNFPTLRSALVAVLRSQWSILFFTVRSFPSNVFLLLRLASLLMALGLGHCIPFHRTPFYGKPFGSLYAQLIAWCGKRCRVSPVIAWILALVSILLHSCTLPLSMFTLGPKIYLGCPGGHLAVLILCKLRLCSPAGQESVSPCI